MEQRKRQRLVAGTVLIGLGIGLYWLDRWQGIGRTAVLLILGGALLGAYLANRVYGYLVPAALLLALGARGVVEATLGYRRSVPFWLGCGFLGIYVVALLYERRSHWWPLVPGLLLTLWGLPELVDVVALVQRHWPLALVLIGVLVLFGAFSGGKRGGGPAPKQA